MIIKCPSCKKHEAQDKLHGQGNRVANPMKDKEKCRCTVCGTEHRISAVIVKG